MPAECSVTAWVALGSNLGDREGYLARAREALAEATGSPLKASAIYRTEPYGPIAQGEFLNQVVALQTCLSPEALLSLCLSIETQLGRQRREHWGPREIDLDLLAHGQATRHSPRLTLPHPDAHRRAFVLVPWCALAPDFRLHGRTLSDWLRETGTQGVSPA